MFQVFIKSYVPSMMLFSGPRGGIVGMCFRAYPERAMDCTSHEKRWILALTV